MREHFMFFMFPFWLDSTMCLQDEKFQQSVAEFKLIVPGVLDFWVWTSCIPVGVLGDVMVFFFKL
jgi:hypothetical protein